MFHINRTESPGSRQGPALRHRRLPLFAVLVAALATSCPVASSEAAVVTLRPDRGWRSVRDRGRTRRCAVVHRDGHEQDRARHDRRADPRVPDPDRRQRALRHHGRTRRGAVVHRVGGKQDRAHHDRGRDQRGRNRLELSDGDRGRARRRAVVHRMEYQHDRPGSRRPARSPRCRSPPLTAVRRGSSPGLMARSGSARRRRTRSGASRRPERSPKRAFPRAAATVLDQETSQSGATVHCHGGDVRARSRARDADTQEPSGHEPRRLLGAHRVNRAQARQLSDHHDRDGSAGQHFHGDDDLQDRRRVMALSGRAARPPRTGRGPVCDESQSLDAPRRTRGWCHQLSAARHMRARGGTSWPQQPSTSRPSRGAPN